MEESIFLDKVFIVYMECTTGGENTIFEHKVYGDYDDAKTEYKRLVSDEKKLLRTLKWEVINEPEYFEAYEKGDACRNHTWIYLITEKVRLNTKTR